ncbi:hypothetical protein [Streptomyces chartreusis]|uniref:Uncharacterized protein n=1 Tax=Streptomyces chartreusis TaxID=1969 RepID=A0A7H8TH84_STRCX|nr:hypothetical protein [Streptomyces chartreusis]QKZ22873.1 hypothetical protein HUT05_39310 [Streptomyces chartreusis]
MATQNPSPSIPPDDFRARRNYLPDEAFAWTSGSYGPPRDMIPEKEWSDLMSLPTDVLLRTADNHGTQLAQMQRLYSSWIMTLPIDTDKAPYIHNAAWDIGDDFNAAIFTTAHGYYRQGLANLRSALDNMTIAAGFAVRQDDAGLQRWLSGTSEPPKFGNARDWLTPTLGTGAKDVLNKLYKELSGYIHSQTDAANVALWGGSNGPVWEPDSVRLVYVYFRDVMAMCLILLAIGWDDFSVPEEAWLLFERPDGIWSEALVAELKQKFGA